MSERGSVTMQTSDEEASRIYKLEKRIKEYNEG
jgi:hypothetical protein